MKFAKKRVEEIYRLTYIRDVILYHYPDAKNWIDNSPETWMKEEIVIFDSFADIERRLKGRILRILDIQDDGI